MLKDKKILLAVSGGIAVYKAAALTSKLVQAGASVKVMMTNSAQEFVMPLTFQALSRQPVYVDTFSEPDPHKIAHIDIADWADLIIVAPATANVIAKIANGIADDMVTVTLLAATAPKFIAPAMNVNMYNNAAVQRNLQTIKKDGYSIIEGDEGYLACGWTGKGRMAEPEVLVDVIQNYFNHKSQQLIGKTVLITAGPTKEKIDPVRYFTNHSSGKMGYALAKAVKEHGGKVILVSGPTNLSVPLGVNRIDVESAQEMYDAVMEHYEQIDVVIKAAAVADYRPKETYEQKRKKQPGAWSIEMERTLDILKTLGETKKSQYLVGFAAESEHVEVNARKKLEGKNLDLIVANDISEEGAGFKGDTNVIMTIAKDGTTKKYPLLSKEQVAHHIVDEIITGLKGQEYV